MYIVCGLRGSWGRSWGALFHLVCKQEELQHGVEVLLDGLFHPFLQQVPFCLNLCVLLPCHRLHGGLQEAQAHQYRALGWREKLDLEQILLESIIKDPHRLQNRTEAAIDGSCKNCAHLLVNVLVKVYNSKNCIFKFASSLCEPQSGGILWHSVPRV